MEGAKKNIISELQKRILLLQGFEAPGPGQCGGIGLGSPESAFPNGVFPTGVIHEMLCSTPEQKAATSGLLAGLLGILMQQGGICLWISMAGSVFPQALQFFNVQPERMIFVDVSREKELLWVMEEALKCTGLAAVIAEVREISFAQSRRLQLAVESSKVTGFLLRTDLRRLSTTTCVARWQISPLPSVPIDGLPGIGYPRWQVDLLRVRNGSPGSWRLEWAEGRFKSVEEIKEVDIVEKRKVG